MPIDHRAGQLGPQNPDYSKARAQPTQSTESSTKESEDFNGPRFQPRALFPSINLRSNRFKRRRDERSPTYHRLNRPFSQEGD